MSEPTKGYAAECAKDLPPSDLDYPAELAKQAEDLTNTDTGVLSWFRKVLS